MLFNQLILQVFTSHFTLLEENLQSNRSEEFESCCMLHLKGADKSFQSYTLKKKCISIDVQVSCVKHAYCDCVLVGFAHFHERYILCIDGRCGKTTMRIKFEI